MSGGVIFDGIVLGVQRVPTRCRRNNFVAPAGDLSLQGLAVLGRVLSIAAVFGLQRSATLREIALARSRCGCKITLP